jgi:hypothetical protein
VRGFPIILITSIGETSMFKIVRIYEDGTESIIVPNLTEEEANKYMEQATTEGTSSEHGSFTSQIVAQ